MRAAAAALLLLSPLTAAPAAAAAPWIGWDLDCDSQELRLADPRHAWRLVGGFSEIGTEGRVVAEDAAALVVLGDPGEETTIYVEARTDARQLDLALELNRRSLGSGTFRKKLRTAAFTVPPGAARRGLNVLRLRLPPDDRRAPRLIVRRVGVGPLRCPGDDPAAIDVAAGEPMILRANSLVMIPLAADRTEPAERVRVSFTGRAAVAVDVSCWTGSDVLPFARLEAGRGAGAHAFLPLAGDCADALGLAFRGEGPWPAHDVRIEIGRDRGWRGRARLQMTLLLLAGLGGGIAIAVRLRSRGWLEWQGPGVPWLDVGGVLLVALAARIVFWFAYPHPGQAGDSYEYLLRAGFLIDGYSDFWRDLDWHTWGEFIRPPGYFALLAWLDAPSRAGRIWLLALHLLLSALTVGLTYLLTLPLFGRLAAWCAGLLLAGYVGSVATFTRILAEPLYIFFAIAGLTGIAWLGRRPGWKLALASGALFGLAALVRPGPIYFPPLAGLLLVPILGWKKGLRLTAVLVLGLTAVVLPWSVRNSLVAGRLVGLETVSIANLLLSHPDEQLLPLGDLDLERPEDYAEYRAEVHRLARSRQTTNKGPHLRRVLVKAARDPVAHLGRTAVNLRELLGPAPDHWLRWILDEQNAVRVARLTTLLNLQYGLLLALAAVGFLMFFRRPRVWPVAAWFLFKTGVPTFFFFALLRFREPTTPVLAAFAGGLVATLVDRLSVVKKPGLS